MAVIGLDHLNIRTPDFTRTLDFLHRALGMRATPLPQFDTMEKTAWVYDQAGRPVLHLADADVRYSAAEVLPANPPRGSGALQHVAFSCTDYDETISRLTAFGAAYRQNVPEPGVRQIFVTDPSDIVFELNFQDA